MALITCGACGTKVEHDNINGLKYKRKSYCYDCFANSFDLPTVDKHMFFLKFQTLFNRNLTNVEWIQCENLIKGVKGDKWDWNKLEMVLTYVYEVENLDESEEYGSIGILPYYEKRAEKFFDHYNKVYDSIEAMSNVEVEEVNVYSNQFTEPKKPVVLKSIDKMINWEEEEDGEI